MSRCLADPGFAGRRPPECLALMFCTCTALSPGALWKPALWLYVFLGKVRAAGLHSCRQLRVATSADPRRALKTGNRGHVWRARARCVCCWLLQDARRAGPLHKVEDPRVDVAVYFIAPHRLKQMDCQFMAELSKVIPVLPVLAKARAASALVTAVTRGSFITGGSQGSAQASRGHAVESQDLKSVGRDRVRNEPSTADRKRRADRQQFLCAGSMRGGAAPQESIQTCRGIC